MLNTLNAATHVVLGEADAALEELRTANESRCPWFFQMLADPRLKPLKGRPEFAALEASLAAMETDALPHPNRKTRALRMGHTLVVP